MRKTINVDTIKDKINDCLKNSTCEPDVRRGMIFALEDILFETGNYKGYAYLDETDNVPVGHLPGINNNVPFDDMNARFANTDDTRRRYY